MYLSLEYSGTPTYIDWYGHTEIPHTILYQRETSFLLLGVDCRYPSEASLLPPDDCNPALVEDYREELIDTQPCTCSHFGSGNNRPGPTEV